MDSFFNGFDSIGNKIQILDIDIFLLQNKDIDIVFSIDLLRNKIIIRLKSILIDIWPNIPKLSPTIFCLGKGN